MTVVSRVGAVVYTPGSAKSRILLDFAMSLRERGFVVAGTVIDTLWDGDGPPGAAQRPQETKRGLDLIDLAGDRSVPLARPDTVGLTVGNWTLDVSVLDEARSILGRARKASADLVIVDKFGPVEGKGDGLAAEIAALLASPVRLLVAVRAEFYEAFDRMAAAHLPGVSGLVRPDLAALWRWWGAGLLVEDMIRSVPDGKVARVLVGRNWTMVEGPLGVGLAATPDRAAPGCRPIGNAGALATEGMAALARRAASWDPMQAAIGWAAINAHHNRKDVVGADANGLALLAAAPTRREGRACIIGRFPDLSVLFPALDVLEREPGTADLPDAAAETVLPRAERIGITASTLATAGVPRYLGLCPEDAPVALIGPGTPLSRRLFSYGLTQLSGFVVTDADGLARAVAEGAATKGIKPFGRQVTLTR